MLLDEMSRSDKVALAALARLLIGLDGQVTIEEQEGLAALAAELGGAQLGDLLDEAAATLRDREAIRRAARAIAHPEVQEAIYGALFDLAARDTVSPVEADLLDWLAETWKLERPATPYRG